MRARSADGPKAAASWFPGHMAAGMRAVVDVADLIDLVIEVRDARLPRTTAVAGLHARLKHKPVIALLNRSDLAEPARTKTWLDTLRLQNVEAYAADGTRAGTLRDLRSDLIRRPRKRNVLRAAVVGAPNTGKSSVINALSRTKRAPAMDKAGVTRHVRWLKLETGVELLDTPGLLAPRIIDADSAWQLAICGSLPEVAFDPEDTIERFHAWLARRRPGLAPNADLEAFAGSRGMRRKGGELDRLNAARKFIALFRAGKLFRVTFEDPESRS